MALRWFRFGKKQEEDAAQESASPEEEAPPEAPQVEQALEPADAVERSEIVASAAVVLSSGFAFRSIARSARRVLPAPIVHAAVAVAGTYLLAKAHDIAEARLHKS